MPSFQLFSIIFIFSSISAILEAATAAANASTASIMMDADGYQLATAEVALHSLTHRLEVGKMKKVAAPVIYDGKSQPKDIF